MSKTPLCILGLVVTILVSLGLVVLASASMPNGLRLHGDQYYFFNRQLIYLGAAIIVGAAAALFDYHRWRDQPVLTGIFFGLVVALLAAVFFFPKVNGSWRWIKLGSLRLQPSEFAKLLSVIATAVILDLARFNVTKFVRGALMPAISIGILAGLVLLEPDFGSVMVIATAGALMMWLAGTRVVHLFLLGVPGAALVLFKVATNANRMARIFAFLGTGPSAGPGAVTDEAAARAAYQAEQAGIAISRGGLWGAGKIGSSLQKLLYLPEAHTDFIFAVGAEEWGLFFSILVVILFAALFITAIYIAAKAQDRFGRYLALGMGYILFFQAFFNLGVVCEALPTKGIALPFFSYGGTNLLSAAFAIGTIMSVAIHTSEDRNSARVVSVDLPRKGR